MPKRKIKRLARQAKRSTVTRIYEIDQSTKRPGWQFIPNKADRVKFRDLDPERRYLIRYKSGFKKVSKIPKKFFEYRPYILKSKTNKLPYRSFYFEIEDGWVYEGVITSSELNEIIKFLVENDDKMSLYITMLLEWTEINPYLGKIENKQIRTLILSNGEKGLKKGWTHQLLIASQILLEISNLGLKLYEKSKNPRKVTQMSVFGYVDKVTTYGKKKKNPF